MAKEFRYRGKTMEELKKLSIEEFSRLIPSRERRSLRRGLSYSQKKLLEELRAGEQNIKTQDRSMIVLPEMVGKLLMIHNGKEYVKIEVLPEMLGHRFGELVMTRQRVKHSAPGVGATRSSKFVALK